LIVLFIKTTKKKNDQFMEAVISRRVIACSRPLNGSSNGAIEVLAVERLRFCREAQRKSHEDRN
jgi:hypothetical protein